MPNPVKSAIKGGIQGIKNAKMGVVINNKKVKDGTAKEGAKKQTLGPINVAKAFVSGAKDPKGAKTLGNTMKPFAKAAKKK